MPAPPSTVPTDRATDKEERHHFTGNWVVVKPPGLPGCSENAGEETSCETPTRVAAMNNLTGPRRRAELLRCPNEIQLKQTGRDNTDEVDRISTVMASSVCLTFCIHMHTSKIHEPLINA